MTFRAWASAFVSVIPVQNFRFRILRLGLDARDVGFQTLGRRAWSRLCTHIYTYVYIYIWSPPPPWPPHDLGRKAFAEWGEREGVSTKFPYK